MVTSADEGFLEGRAMPRFAGAPEGPLVVDGVVTTVWGTDSVPLWPPRWNSLAIYGPVQQYPARYPRRIHSVLLLITYMYRVDPSSWSVLARI